MPSSSSQRARTGLTSPPPPLRWRVWYVAEYPGWAVSWLVFLVVVWAGVVWVTGRGYLGWLAVGILLLASWRLWIPIGYGLSIEGIQEAIGPMRWTIPWKAIGRYEVAESGVWLFPKNSARSGGSSRGMYLPWAEHRQQVLAYLHHYLDNAPETTPKGTSSSGTPAGVGQP